MRKERNHYTAEEKVTILRRHLLDKVPVSDLCEENELQPTVFYRWQEDAPGRAGIAREQGWKGDAVLRLDTGTGQNDQRLRLCVGGKDFGFHKGGACRSDSVEAWFPLHKRHIAATSSANPRASG
jgi:Transposase